MNEKIEQEKKLKHFLLILGKAGEIADKVSDLILFHNRVRENAEKRHVQLNVNNDIRGGVMYGSGSSQVRFDRESRRTLKATD